MLYAFLADALVVAHLAYVLFVIVGLILILVGWPLRWRWIRSWRFRLLHFVAIAVVALETLADVPCPLTTWELDLRRAAGQIDPAGVDDEEVSFVGRLVRDVLFVTPEEVSEETLRACHYAFAGAVLVTLFLVPPRRREPADR